MMSSLCFTGHRPKDFDNQLSMAHPIYKDIIKQLTIIVERYILLGVDTFYSGTADGIDLIAFFVVAKLKQKYPYIKNITCTPFIQQPNIVKCKDWHNKMLEITDQNIVVSTIPEYKCSNLKGAYQKRNEYMVDNSDYVIAVWNGKNSGGTYNCIRYAKKQNKKITYIYFGGNDMNIYKFDYVKSERFDYAIDALKTIVKEKDSDKMKLWAKSIIDVMQNEQDTYKVKFNNTQLDELLSTLPIKDITENMVCFQNDGQDVYVTIK